MTKATFSLQPRELIGKSVKSLRRNRMVPVNLVVPHQSSVATAAEYQALNNLYSQVGDTGLVYLTVGDEKKTRPALIEDIQRNPITGELLHVVFRQVNLKEKLKANVPVEVVGESSVPDAVVMTIVSEIEVEALPTDLPEKFVVSIEGLTEIGQMITFQDLEYDKSLVTLMVSEEELSSPVVMLQAQAAEEPEAEVSAEGDAAAATEGEAAAATEAEKAE